MKQVQVDRRAFIAKLGGAAVVATTAPEILADALEHEMMDTLDQVAPPALGSPMQRMPASDDIRRGTGRIFDSRNGPLFEMPKNPTLVDFYIHRFAPASHVMRSATHALKTGQPERTIFACLVHDVVLNLVKPDHGWWGAQLFEPYVDERVSWGIRYHQALRFYPDDSVGYEYPEMYNRMFGKDYVPDQYVEDAYMYARKHKLYMEARLITLNDEYGLDPNMDVTMDPFVDIIGRQFKQPKEGLGFDNSPSAHMWRTLINPERPL